MVGALLYRQLARRDKKGGGPGWTSSDPHRDAERGDRPYRRRSQFPPRSPPQGGREPHRRRRQGDQRRPGAEPAGPAG